MNDRQFIAFLTAQVVGWSVLGFWLGYRILGPALDKVVW